MASFLLSNALKGANNLSTLVDKVSQMKDQLEKQMDSAVGHEEEEEEESTRIITPPTVLDAVKEEEEVVMAKEEDISEPMQDEDDDQEGEEDDDQEDEEDGVDDDEVPPPPAEAESPVVDETSPQVDPADDAPSFAPPPLPELIPPSPSPTPTATTSKPAASFTKLQQLKQAQEALARREQQLEKTSRKLAEQEDAMQALRDQIDSLASDKRVKLAEAKADGLMREGLALAEREGKAQATVRKLRQERDDLAQRERQALDSHAKELEGRQRAEAELFQLREAKRRDELDKAHLSESSSETRKRAEELKHQLAQHERRELEAKLEMERLLLDVQEQKKLVFSLSQQLSQTKREADNAKFQLKEQLDNGHLHGNRADLMERTLHEAKLATEEQWREANQIEVSLRAQLAKANDQLAQFERRAEEAAQRALELTSPLLRQIDQLNEQRNKQELAASALLTRAVTSEAAEAEAVAGKRKAELARGELALRISELETQVSALQMDCTRAVADGKLAVRRAEDAERERDQVHKQLDVLRQTSDGKVAEYRQTEMQLRQAVQLETDHRQRDKRQWEAKVRELEHDKQQHLQQQQQQQQQQQPVQQQVPSSAASVRSVASSSAAAAAPASASAFTSQEDILGSVLFGDDFSVNSIAVDFSDSSSKFLLQASELQAGVRRRDLRISALQEQLDLSQKQREELAREQFALKQQVARLVGLEGAHEQLATLKHQNALLCELLGEKEEQIEGLQSDVDALKQQFRDQFIKL